jgi:hypothetical protein
MYSVIRGMIFRYRAIVFTAETQRVKQVYVGAALAANKLADRDDFAANAAPATIRNLCVSAPPR